MEVSSGSACGSGSIQPSAVLEAIGMPEEQNISTIRISFGRENTKENVILLAKTLGSITRG
jgi:cysteine desulfurase